ncbi:hypothetical protein [Neobacillus drentensis]|uniref:hypothetical protein n=1 Tax=Neobacillus drentensis TaxID=220684 RepID=UPI002FFD5DCF
MEEPIVMIKHPKWEIITFELIQLLCIGGPLIMTIKWTIEKNHFLIVYGLVLIMTFILLFRHYRGDVRGYVAVYSDRIVDAKKRTQEVLIDNVVEVKYFKKKVTSRQTWYIDCLQFHLKNQTEPIQITLSSRGTVTPHTMRAETSEIWNYLRTNYPTINYTKENWNGPY